MPLLIDNADFRRTYIGMPDSHAAQFKEIAHDQKCVIICRAVGPTCLQLLEQGYDTKGFRVHAKSCDWGPMAGFVLRDPRLNKGGTKKEVFNRHEHEVALTDGSGANWRAGTVPLKIYPERFEWLRSTGKINVVQVAANKLFERFEGMEAQAGVRFHYALFKQRTARGVLYGVYFDTTKGDGFRQETGLARTVIFERWEPMLAMTNPYKSWPEGDFRNAITGDYDLFGIWPLASEYEHEGADRRVLGTARAFSQIDAIDALERKFTVEGEGTKLGNMTDRIYLVCQLLNSAIGTAVSDRFGPFPNRMVCWHSDEAARPGVSDVDLPLIAFSKGRKEIGIRTIADFKNFIKQAKRLGYQVTLAEGWIQEPTKDQPNRLGAEGYEELLPQWKDSAALKVPKWYNS